MIRDITKIPNLISLGRLIFLVPTAYFLSQPDPNFRLYALITLTVAAITDYFDGYFARKLDQKTELGLILDPLSDKILAGVLVILLILYRSFPIWLAVIVLGRDILLLSGGLIIKSKTGRTPSSNLSGKYCFASIAALLISYVIEFDFGITMMTTTSIALVGLSLVVYARIFAIVMRGRSAPVFADKPSYRFLRTAITLMAALVYLYFLLQYIN